MPPSMSSIPYFNTTLSSSHLSNITSSFFNSSIHLTAPTWGTPTQASIPQQRTLDLFMVLFVSIFLFLTAAILRLMPVASSTSAARILRRGHESDRIINYSPFTYGAVENITHVQSLATSRTSRSRPPTYEALIDLEDRIGQAKIGFTDDQITVLPTYLCGEDDDQGQLDRRGTTCAICRDRYTKGQPLTLLPCGDEYHSECITPWLKQQATCPLCRSRFA